MKTKKQRKKLPLPKPPRQAAQQEHARYGYMRINYAQIGPYGLTLGWSCALGFGELSLGCNWSSTRNEGIGYNEPGAFTHTLEPGIHLDTEYMGPNFAAEVMRAVYWSQERGETIPKKDEWIQLCTTSSVDAPQD